MVMENVSIIQLLMIEQLRKTVMDIAAIIMVGMMVTVVGTLTDMLTEVEVGKKVE
jgi:hypothetical protein